MTIQIKKYFLTVLLIFWIFFISFCSIDSSKDKDKKKEQEQLLFLSLFVLANSNSLIGMSEAYFNHTATLLNDGNVLVRGNTSAELYDATTNTFSQITTELSDRESHTATLLNNGKVLIVGGISTTDGTIYYTAEIYDPSTNAFTSTGNMNSARFLHAATLMQDGKVLITGGHSDCSSNLCSAELSSAEIYDPNRGSFASTGSMNYTRIGHTATLKSDGKVIIIGGFGFLNIPRFIVEEYDSSTGSFTEYTSQSRYLTFARGYHRATLLSNGDILITGGFIGNVNIASTDNTEVYNSYSYVKGRMSSPRSAHTATLLQSGKVLVAGGQNFELYSRITTPKFSSLEIYDPTEEKFKNAGNMLRARSSHTATLLKNGKILITGGTDRKNAELYSP